MGASQLKYLVISSFLYSSFGNCIANGIADEKTRSVVKLINKEETSSCSGTIIGSNPVTVLTAFHCTNVSLTGDIYLDLRQSPAEAANMNAIIEAINPPKTVDMSAFKNLSPVDLGNGIKFDPKNIPENGLMTFGGPLKIPAPQLKESWKATEFILSPVITETAAYAEYADLLNDRIEIKLKLDGQTQRLETLTKANLPSETGLTLSGLLFGSQQSPEMKELKNEILSLTEEFAYISRRLKRASNDLIGHRIGDQKAQDVMIIVFENHKIEGTMEELFQKREFSPILSDQGQIEEGSEYTLHGYGKESVFDPDKVKLATRKRATNYSVPLEESEDPGFLKFRGLLKDSKSEKFPPGTYASMIEGDSGGSVQKDDAVVAVLSHYDLRELKGQEMMSGWPHYHKHSGDSEFVEFFTVRTDSLVASRLLDFAKSQGADIIYKDADTGELFRK